MFDSLDLVERAPELKSVVDVSRIGAVGHSAGGNTAFNALNDPRIKVAVGWAPVPPSGPPANKPTMIIGAGADNALTPAELAKEYASFPAPKRFVEIGGNRAGHNTFTDVCVVIRGGGGLVQFALKNHFITPGLAKLATNGCASNDMDPAQFWPVVQHFTVAELRDALGIDPQPVGLGDGIVNAFDGVKVVYRHEP
jgi:predicted dienelactone hydrolase